MSDAKIIDGKATALSLRARVAEQAQAFADAAGRLPGLAVVLVGEDPASAVYVRAKERASAEAHIGGTVHRLPATTTQEELLALVRALNADTTVDGILVQLPLPPQIDAHAIIAAIDPEKDVDGFHPINAGRLASGLPGFVPCTPLGCLMLLKDYHDHLAGLEAVVVGRSNIVGKPMAQLLLAESCTVTIAHSRTRDLFGAVRRSDIVIAAVGVPELIRGDWIKPGATVIDVGINRVTLPDGKTKLIGDVAYDEAIEVAGAITPVPGGVGPMTIAVLLRNTLVAAHRKTGIALDERTL
ncbi:bifunctional methylenetetrahydrofolate dehydrogenase/methenyltetrahydrofolate cyclohydrolase FolD [Sphingomonas sp. BIUV-7]|uniref:Bifunctional protein FolD n=1 Tax=Sphingomonas natans TaxID=3063330 RepID=A0ABT8YDY2_9SPHN|nr:bifunctional methylenetetrahydrofolate dehydrogenase/methenyltetrahydrofolate cyclohydrolase FolD [Sphingomonas sp. BIUV-7]MDO6416581.1 bifunctional methylenetetrahydrofolate dehydrogenase/methenyltetrahydrofolate cyclohydrolase FolD [Sphingomonas sp. BIUV-7]